MSKKSKISAEFQAQLDGSPMDILMAAAPKSKSKPKVVQKQEEAPAPERAASTAKERMTVQISQDVIERVKDAVYWDRITVAQFVEEALEASLHKLEKQRGEPYQKRRSELKPGRPTK